MAAAPASLSAARRDRAVTSLVERMTQPVPHDWPLEIMPVFRSVAADLRSHAADRSMDMLEHGQVVPLFAGVRVMYRQIMALCAGPDFPLFQMNAGIRGPAGQVARWATADEQRFSEDSYFEDLDKMCGYFDATLHAVQILGEINKRRRLEIGAGPADPVGRSPLVDLRDRSIMAAVEAPNHPFSSEGAPQ